MSFSSPFSAYLLVPLTLLTPYIFVLHYSISVLELIVFAYLILMVFPAISKSEVRVPKGLLIFYLLFTFGHLGALLNGLKWHVPVGIWNLNFFYKMLLGLGAFLIGVHFKENIREVFRSKMFLVTAIVLASIAIVYPFLAYETKIAYFGILYPPDSGFEKNFTSRQLPGLGINANIYAFMVFSYLLFSFRSFLYRQMSFVVPLLLFLVILVLSSKLAIALTVGACVFMLLRRFFSFSLQPAKGSLRLAISRHGFLILSIVLLMIATAWVVAVQTETGRAAVDSYATVMRIQRLLDEAQSPDGGSGPLAGRIMRWKKGLERAEMAPFLGIARDPFERGPATLVGFNKPHNEFLRMWMLYGLGGFVAWTYLIGYMIYKNAKYGADPEWIILYGALIFFMTFDGGLDDPRVTVYIFLLLGLNWAALNRDRAIMNTTEESENRATGPVLA